MSKKWLLLLGLLVVSMWLSAEAANATTQIPKECKRDAFLTITGNIGRTTNSASNSYEMSEREFLALPASTVTTSTPWTSKSDFVGPLLSKVLGEVEAKGKKLRLTALDDFSVEVDADYLEKYGTILAARKDGVRLTTRDFGPIFLMYPRDSFREELDTPAAMAYLVWQLCRIEVE